MAGPYKGKDVFIYIDLNGAGGAGASWSKIGKQRTGGYNRGTTFADAGHKDDNQWETALPVKKNWVVSVDGLLDTADAAYALLESSQEGDTAVYVKIDRSSISGTSKEGKAWVSGLNEEFNDGETVKFTCELKGDGAPATATV